MPTASFDFMEIDELLHTFFPEKPPKKKDVLKSVFFNIPNHILDLRSSVGSAQKNQLYHKCNKERRVGR